PKPAASAGTNAEQSKEFQMAIKSAIEAFDRKDYVTAETRLDAADLAAPRTSIAANLRGAIHLDRREWDDAAKAFHEAIEIAPKSFPPQFNLTEIPFHQKKYAAAREQLIALKKQWPGEEIISFKIFLTYLLEKNDPAASTELERLKFPGSTPAYYYANAAWELAHGNEKKGLDWIKSAEWIFSKYLNFVFAEALSEIDLIQRPVPTRIEAIP
ncbi:MAG: hypothetical protein QOD99_1660, partial [Chthoniobacter sp.]|nr:hypothetical protein [Chthoniobacter sp.]